MFLTCFDKTTFSENPRTKMKTVSRFSRQNDAGLRALTVALWENLVPRISLKSSRIFRKVKTELCLTSLLTILTANNKTKKTFLSVFILKVETNKKDIAEEHNTFVEFEVNAFNSPSRTFMYLRATRVSLTTILHWFVLASIVLITVAYHGRNLSSGLYWKTKLICPGLHLIRYVPTSINFTECRLT